MRTIDHWTYAERMMKDLKMSRAKKLAFQLGCVMPDFNKFSYMGHHLNDWAKGHSFKVRRREIHTFFDRPCRDTVLWWFLAGLKVHYLGDSFSRPHNPEFGYDSDAHVNYEWKLHNHTHLVLKHRPYRPAKVSGSLAHWLSRRHERYMKLTRGVRDDAYFIDTTLMGFWEWMKKNVLHISM